MGIDWAIVGDDTESGEEMLALMGELFPLPRSLTGNGVRSTLAALGRDIPVRIVETPTDTKVFDWAVPREWNLLEAWIEGPDGVRILDAEDSALHVLGYSTAVDKTVSLDELREHVYTHHDDPDLTPYRTSYWKEQWGFCMSQRLLDSLSEGEYRVRIDSILAPGSLTTGEVRLAGSSEREFLMSTYLCHPALANDNLSGVVLLWALAKALANQELRYTYRLHWGPGTLGALCWLNANLETLDRVDHGLTIACVGDHGPLRYKRSRRETADVDRAAALVLARTPESIVTCWEPTGGDERQFCSPGFNLPVGVLSRTPHGYFPEYHSSADNLDLITAEALAGARRALLEIIDELESNAVFLNLASFGEPQLGKRGLYPDVPDGTNLTEAYLWVLSLSDGETDLLAIAERSGLSVRVLRAAADKLAEKDLVAQVGVVR